MTDGYGQQSTPSLAEWSHHPDCSCSKTSLGCSLLTTGTLWEMSFVDWPASGLWDAIGFYKHQTSEPATDAVDGSALLPTPAANDAGRSPEADLESKRSMARFDGTPRTQITSLTVLTKAGFSQPRRRRTVNEDPTTPDNETSEPPDQKAMTW